MRRRRHSTGNAIRGLLMREIITSCTCDCPDTCSIVAEVEGDRAVRLRGNPDFEITRGFLCRRSKGFLKRVHSPDRILYPLRRDGARWERLSWDEATDIIADRIDSTLRKYGPLSLFYYKDAGSISALKHVNERFFNLLGGATFSSGSLCGGAGIAGQTADFGERTSHAPMDVLHSRLIVIWGRNPAWTNVHLVPILRQARERGIPLVLVDPLETATARLVDKHVSPVPGSDAYLALGMAKCLEAENLLDTAFLTTHTEGHGSFLSLARNFDLKQLSELTGVSSDEIRDLAILYGRSKPAAILGGWGLQRRRNGANTYRLLDALGALTGNIGVRGGGVSHGMDETRWFDKSVRLRDRARMRREVPRPRTGKGILEAKEPPIKVAIVSGANPANQCPNTNLVRKAFEQVGFVAVMDMFMTDTAELADIVLPSTHFLQERDVVGSYWHNYLMPVNVAQSRLGEEKTDLEAFALIGKKLSMDETFSDNPDYYLEAMLAPLVEQGLTLDKIMHGPVRPSASVDVPFEGGKFKTASGKFTFVNRIAGPASLDACEYPYHLISPHPHERTHSQLATKMEGKLQVVQLAPAAAKELAIREGERVSVETPYGSLSCRVALAQSQRRDTVLIYEGWWDKLGGSVNRLTSDELSDMGESATYHDAMCRIVKE